MKRVSYILLLFLASCVVATGQSSGNCPEITAIGPSGLTQPGELMTFTANGGDSGSGKLVYNWAVSSGAIESGQGTAAVKIRTTAEMAGTNVTATVKITGLAAGCNDTASEIAGITGFGCGLPVDEFGKLSKYDVRARIDNFLIQLNKEPESEGLILVYLNTKESRAFKLTYLNNIYDAILFLKYDPARVTFVVVEDDHDTGTRLWTVPPAADARKLTEGGTQIKGEEFKQKIKTLFSKTN